MLEELSSNVADEEEDEGNETGGGDAEYGGGKLVLSLEPATNPKITVSTGENDSNSNEGLCSKTVDPFVRYYKKNIFTIKTTFLISFGENHAKMRPTNCEES